MIGPCGVSCKQRLKLYVVECPNFPARQKEAAWHAVSDHGDRLIPEEHLVEMKRRAVKRKKKSEPI